MEAEAKAVEKVAELKIELTVLAEEMEALRRKKSSSIELLAVMWRGDAESARALPDKDVDRDMGLFFLGRLTTGANMLA